jgi:two-component system OmpR family response regulator
LTSPSSIPADPARRRVAVVEDDAGMRQVVADLVTTAGLEPVCFESAEALDGWLAHAAMPDLIILDLQLPGRDGLAAAGSLRARGDTPIIMLTGRGDDIDRIIGLEVGADDYVVKPFNNRELLARIKAVLRRSSPPSRSGRLPRNGFRFAGYLLDLDARRLDDPQGEPVSLTVAEFDLLLVLLRSAGRVLTRDQLLEMTHRGMAEVFDRTIDVLILRLRRKIEPSQIHPRFIRTERGHGYVFDVPVERLEYGLRG